MKPLSRKAGGLFVGSQETSASGHSRDRFSRIIGLDSAILRRESNRSASGLLRRSSSSYRGIPGGISSLWAAGNAPSSSAGPRAACGACMAASLGLKVPQDLSVAGFDDIGGAAEFHLTTARVDKKGMGQRAIQYLFRLREPPLEHSGFEELPMEWVARDSSWPAKPV
ncbi:MAG: substrate-binding domain-containing protein [bacterium]